MKGVQSKINKLTLAFQMKGKILKINQEQFYSSKYDKVFNKYKVKETCPEEITLKKTYKEIKSDLKKGFDEELYKKFEKIKTRLDNLYVPNMEFKNKMSILIYLAERYKVICDG